MSKHMFDVLVELNLSFGRFLSFFSFHVNSLVLKKKKVEKMRQKYNKDMQFIKSGSTRKKKST